MNQQIRFPVTRLIVVSIVVLIISVGLTLLSFAFQGSDQINAGNLCGVNQDEPCLVPIPKAGWPLPYFVDKLGTSAMGVIGFEDFRMVAFLLDLLFFVLLLSGVGILLNRTGLVRLI